MSSLMLEVISDQEYPTNVHCDVYAFAILSTQFSLKSNSQKCHVHVYAHTQTNIHNFNVRTYIHMLTRMLVCTHLCLHWLIKFMHVHEDFISVQTVSVTKFLMQGHVMAHPPC